MILLFRVERHPAHEAKSFHKPPTAEVELALDVVRAALLDHGPAGGHVRFEVRGGDTRHFVQEADGTGEEHLDNDDDELDILIF